ncbi:hypothetical protein FBU31_007049 [Coemansia sp. 'formosensis']|nr:hypothetical protein FBU31_007049 [Coemansia sp. 'formosensis']
MVCVICCDSLFGALRDEPDTSSAPASNNRIAALRCGHTFHLECIASWHNHDNGKSCPLCKAQYVGPVLKLHVECDRKHVADHIRGDLGPGKISINDRATAAGPQCDLLLKPARRQELEYEELEAMVAALQIELDENNDLLKGLKESDNGIYVKLARLDKRGNELKSLSLAHKAHIRSLQAALDLKKQIIAELENKIRENEGSFS